MKNKQKNWYSIALEAPTEAEEALEFALNELDSMGSEINTLDKKEPGFTRVTGYFNAKIDERVFREKLFECLKIYGFSSEKLKIEEWREVENQDWIAEWKKHWKSTETGKFIIAPPWEELENQEKIIIRIEPQMAFGTGTHETTRLCLRAVEEHYSPEMSFFDLGTGTGILAVGAAKIQGKSKKAKGKIAGCDTDEEAVEIARENAYLNGENDIDFFAGSISAETPSFDFVCANVTADVILPLLPLLLEKTRKILVLSGILVEQEALVTEKLRLLGSKDFTVKTDGEWIGIIVRIPEI